MSTHPVRNIMCVNKGEIFQDLLYHSECLADVVEPWVPHAFVRNKGFDNEDHVIDNNLVQDG